MLPAAEKDMLPFCYNARYWPYFYGWWCNGPKDGYVRQIDIACDANGCILNILSIDDPIRQGSIDQLTIFYN